MTQQLELPLWDTLRSAQMVPEQVNFKALLEEVEQLIARMPETEQLRSAGEAFLRVAEVYAMRSETWIAEWEQSSRDPAVEHGFFDDLVRQTMAVNLGDLMEPVPPRKQRAKKEPRQKGSIVVPVEKSVVLAMVDQMEAEAVKQEAVLAIAHDENVSTWIEAIDGWLRTAAAGPVPFEQICQDLGMPQIEVWLGVLLGGFELESQGEFYSGLLWVRRLSSEGIDTTGAIAP